MSEVGICCLQMMHRSRRGQRALVFQAHKGALGVLFVRARSLSLFSLMLGGNGVVTDYLNKGLNATLPQSLNRCIQCYCPGQQTPSSPVCISDVFPVVQSGYTNSRKNSAQT